MELRIHENKPGKIAELKPGLNLLKDLDDFVDLLGNASYLGADLILINKNDLPRDFFDLKTGIAGEILQKFSNYNQRLAVIGDFSGIESKSLKDFIRESNRTGRILFMENKEMALERFNQK